jgi:5-methylcytosine-specific restriction protein A
MSDVGTTPRRPMSKSRRLRIFEFHKGICVLCKAPIDGVRDHWTVEHMRALGLGGADQDDNCGPAHETCRREKDKVDVRAIAKAKRAKSRHLGIVDAPKLKGSPFPNTGKSAKRQERAASKQMLAPKSLYRTQEPRP